MRITLVLGALAVAALLLWLRSPSPIRSEAFDPGPPPPLEGALAVNRALDACVRISVGEIPHSDKLLIDARGRVYAGDDQGRIHRLTPQPDGGYSRDVVARIDGRPMELDFAPDGRLVVADLAGPHVVIDAQGGVTRLATLGNLPMGTAGLAVASDGVLYYGAHTETHSADGSHGILLDMLESRPGGELRAYDPTSGEERTLVTGLYTPVGVELSAREDFVAVAEFFAYRVTRHWLTGPRAGTSDLLLENLPGMVDGLASDGRGTFYVTLPAYRSGALDWLNKRPRVKDQLAKLVEPLHRLGFGPDPAGTAVLAVDEEGRVLRSFHDPDGRHWSQITAAEVDGDQLVIGSIAGDWIARCPLSP